MRTIILAALFSVCVGVSAWAESTQADWDKYAQPIVIDFAKCVVKEVDRTLSASQTAEKIADAAIQACDGELKPLRAVLVSAPFEATQHTVDETFNQVVGEVRAAAVAEIEKRKD